MRRNLSKALALAFAMAACGPTPGHGNGNGDGPDANGGGGDAADPGNGDGSISGDGCSDEAKLIYVVDENRTLSQFDPKTKTFNDLGTLACTNTASPFSMAIARDATAWVLYDVGDLYHVDIKNNRTCTKAAWTRSTDGLKVFGMGFSTDQVGGTTDTLFISGGASITDSVSKLNRLDLSSFQPNFLGNVTGWPELTGTGSAELWGFFPSETTARIAQLSKTNGAELRAFSQPTLNNPNQSGGKTAWAFAFHGGSFWVFLKKYGEAATSIYQVNSTTGTIVGPTPTSGRSIVGAGVSTCAPVIIL